MKENARKKTKLPEKLLPIAACAVLAVALVLTFASKGPADSEAAGETASVAPETVQADGGDLLIRADDVGATASYYDYDADGTTVQVFAVRASDGAVHLALNTCQVCNGSPYAYFEQDGDMFVCQNCRNRFAAAAVGRVSGGCNPVPITEDTYTEADGVITIPASFLEDNAVRFTNWKRF